MAELIVHVGFPKCASTLMQRHVFPRIPGVSYYPAREDSQLYAALALRSFPGTEVDRADVLRRFEEKFLSHGGMHLISAEHFVMPANCLLSAYPRKSGILESQQILDLLQSLSIPVRILMFTRRQQDWLPSWHQERVKRFETRTLEQFVRAQDAEPILRLIRYTEVLADLRQRFGDDRLTVIPFELLRREPDALRRELAGLFKAEIPDLNLPPVRVKISPVSLSLRLQTNKLLVSLARLTGGDTPVDRAAFRFCKSIYAHDAVLRYFPQPVADKDWLPASRIEEYAESNRQLGEMIGRDLGALGYSA